VHFSQTPKADSNPDPNPNHQFRPNTEGLSYTSFNYTELVVNGYNVSVTVNNTGDSAGAEVAQLYIGFPAIAEEPPMQLKGYGARFSPWVLSC
jgi:hypothetical protein